ncbi:LysR family transcriptional regulator [Bacillus sp. JJ1503]|uniref:LysR family transcriptional regulator n=1 Tax=Bacillus sp. JJ1503 TaxID=3122956 RepID=UPI002FFF1503
MKKEYIEAFLEIVKTLNITKASENLHLTQSALSNRLKLMENELGTQLIIRFRGNRFIELTKQGEEFIEIAERWMLLFNETKKLKHNLVPSLIIGSVDSFHNTVLYPIYLQISKNDVPVTLQVRTHQSMELYKFVENREIDVAFVSFERNVRNVVIEPIFKQCMCIAINNGNKGKRNIGHPAELDPSKEIFMNWGKEFEHWHNKWWGESFSPQLETDSMSVLNHFMNIENNWAVVPVSAFNTLFSENSNIEMCDLGSMSPPDRICYMIKHKHNISPSHSMGLKLFEQLLTDYIHNDSSLMSV